MVPTLLVPTVPEPELLVLLGCGLILLARLVQRFCPSRDSPLPKAHQVTVWIAPPELAEYYLPSLMIKSGREADGAWQAFGPKR